MDEEHSHQGAGNGAVDLGLQNLLHQAQDKLRDQRAEYEEAVRQAPGKSVLLAAAGGYLLSQLPLAAVFRGAISLAVLLLRPAMMIFGGAKVYQWLREQDSAPISGEEEEVEATVPRPGFSSRQGGG